MKKSLAFCIVFIATHLFLVSCFDAEPLPVPEPDSDKNIVKTSLRLVAEGGVEILPPTQDMASRSSFSQDADLIGIQVFSYDSKDVPTPYCYGVFSSLAAVPSLELLESGVYSIDVTILPDGQKMICTDDAGAYYKPFTVATKPQLISNEFISSTWTLSNISVGECEFLVDGRKKGYARPLVVRYAGYSGKFSPRDSSVVNIVAKRVYVGLKIRVEGLTTGRVELTMSKSQVITILPAYNKRDTLIMMSLSGVVMGSSVWADDGYNESLKCDVNHFSVENISTPIAPIGGLQMNVTRNYTHPIIVRLNKSGDAQISIEQGDMIVAPPTEI